MDRDELVEMVAELLDSYDLARAALAIIEPAVREECAKLAEDYAPAIKKITGLPVVGMVEAASRTIAAAIRAGAKP